MPEQPVYRLEHRYQDSGWMELPHEVFEHAGDAIIRADELSMDAINFGMVRVVRISDCNVIRVFAAGHN